MSIVHIPRRRVHIPGFLFQVDNSSIPEHLRDLVSVEDPDIEYVIDAIQHMRHVGCDVEDPAIIRIAVEAGHRRAARENDDSGLDAQRRADRYADAAEARAQIQAARENYVVYYARIGNRVKIGYSSDVHARLRAFSPEELMATEPGGPKRESERHAQFASLRTTGEWFRLEGALAAHIAVLQAKAA